MASEVEVALRNLAIARHNKEKADAAVAATREAVEKTPEWAAYQAAADSSVLAAQAVAAMDAEMRNVLLNYYQQTGDKRPTPGASIQIHSRLQYDPAAAIEWCRTNAPALIETKLTKNFEKVAEKLGAPVEVVNEARVVLAGNLNGYLPGDLMTEHLNEALAEE